MSESDCVDKQETGGETFPLSKMDGCCPSVLVAQFHEKYGMPNRVRDGLPSSLDYDRLGMRMGLICEELLELFQAVYGKEAAEVVGSAIEVVPDGGEKDVVATADALADLVYVIYGMALESGIDLDAVLAEVHLSNLSKLMPDGTVLRRADGKILKGPNFREPNVAGVIRTRDNALNETAKICEEDNPLLEPSPLPFGVPDFQNIKFEHLEPAFLAGIALEKEEWRRIANNSEEPNVENTVEAVDGAGELLDRVESVFETLSSSIGGSKLDDLNEKLAPVLAQHSDDFFTDKDLYERFCAVSELPDLDPETRWTVDEIIRDFQRSGVNLSVSDMKLLRKMNMKIAVLEAQIEAKISNQLAQTFLTGTDVDDLEGLSEDQIFAAREAGKEKGVSWKLTVSNTSVPAQLASLTNPVTRKRLLQVSLGRGSTGDTETDPRELIVELAEIRYKRARLLGFDSHAHIVMDQETVPSVQEARELLTKVGKAALIALDRESELYQQMANPQVMTAADWPFYEDRARHDSLGVDSEELKQYFELSRVVEQGIFYAANRLYGLQFKRRHDIVGWVREVQSWEVLDENGCPIGLFMADFFKRPGKSGGAWMSSLESGSKRTGRLPVITNNANFDPPNSSKRTLLSWDDVETVFHEFGHALHGLLSKTYYQRNAGTEVPRDFVELPSQLNEMWAFHPDVLGRYARHWETGDPLPKGILDAIVGSKKFGQPHATLEYVQSALIDQSWHSSFSEFPNVSGEIDTFEERLLENVGVAHPLVVPRYRSSYFAHTFSLGYDSGYYAYMWSEAMVGELEQWLQTEMANGDGGLNREAGEVLRSQLLSCGNSRDPMESFVAVLGRLPDSEAVVRRRGLDTSVG